MAAVNHDHLKAGSFCKDRSFTVTFHDIRDLLFRQGGHFSAVRAHAVARAVLGQALFFIFVCHVGSGILAGMGKFHARDCPVALDGICRKGKGCQGTDGGKVQMKHMRTIGFRMNHELTHGHSCCTAFCSELIKGPCPLAGHTVFVDVGGSNRRSKHAVAEGDISQGDGLT